MVDPTGSRFAYRNWYVKRVWSGFERAPSVQSSFPLASRRETRGRLVPSRVRCRDQDRRGTNLETRNGQKWKRTERESTILNATGSMHREFRAPRETIRRSVWKRAIEIAVCVMSVMKPGSRRILDRSPIPLRDHHRFELSWTIDHHHHRRRNRRSSIVNHRRRSSILSCYIVQRV